jgi:hypothetical protein
MATDPLPQHIHQAYFGAVNGISHGQLASSLTDADLRAFLVAFTDRPGMLPAGIVLPPYLAAAVHGNYYLVSRTWPDTAVARAGMVFTHVLLLPLSLAREVTDLAAILRLLVPRPPALADRPALLTPLTLELTTGDEPTRVQSSDVPTDWLLVAQRLVERAVGTSIFVIGEANDFEQLLVSLWRGLPSLLRTSLTWSIRFTPPGGQEASPLLVSVPPELATKWRGKDVVLLDPATMQSPVTALEQLLFGGEQQLAFREFIADLQLRVDSFNSLKRCQQAYELTQKLQQNTVSTDELLLLVRVLNSLQPDPEKAIAVKVLAVEALAQALTSEVNTQILSLRNLPITAFSTGETQISQAVSQSVRRLVTTSAAGSAQTGLLEQLAETDPSRIQLWWQRAAEQAFTQALASGTTTEATVVWLGLTHSTATRAYTLQVIPQTFDWQQLLQLTIPNQLLPGTAEPMIDFSIDRTWWDLAAAVVAVAYAPAEALVRQLKAERPLGLKTSPRLDKLAAKVSDNELVALAINESNSQLQELAGARCEHNLNLLALLDVRQQAWRSIWSASLRYTKSITAGLIKPAETIRAFLAEVASGQATEREPLELLALSPFANVLDLPERAQLWGQLPEKLRPLFLNATLDALVEAILTPGWTGTVEAILREAAQGRTFNTRFLYQQRSNPAALLIVDRVLQNLQDDYLRDYLTNLPALDSITATQIGKLIATRRWQQSADALFARAKVNSDFRPALQECADLFSLWNKLLHPALFNHQTANRDAWRALEQLMKQLFDKGPGESGIWRRAGGDPAELPNAPSPAAQWEATIHWLRQGGGGGVTASSLVQTALRQYQHPGLQALASSLHLFNIS